MKNKIIKLIFSFIISFSFISFVDAQGIYDNVKNGDIIIGNTAFRSGTWISATRAGKAGALFTKNTSSIDVKTYKVITTNLWYELDDDGQYRKLEDYELDVLENNLKIFYENNNPINIKYDKLKNELGVPTELSFLLNLYNSEDSTFIINDSNIIFDKSDNTVTCPFDYEFEFSLLYADNTSIDYVGRCSQDDIVFEEKDLHNLIDIKINNVQISNVNYPNQSKISLKNSVENFYYTYKVNEELETFDITDEDLGLSLDENKYVMFDIKFDENNNIYHYSFLNKDSNNELKVVSRNIDNNTVRIYVPIKSTILNTYHFVILDNYRQNYKDLYIDIDDRKDNTYYYEWDSEKDTAGKQRLFLYDKDGIKINGYATIKYKDTNYEERIYVPETGKLLLSDVVLDITNISKEE